MNCHSKKSSSKKQKKAEEKNNVSLTELDIDRCRTLQDAVDYMHNFRSFVMNHNYKPLKPLVESIIIEIFEKLHAIDSNYSMVSVSETDVNYSKLLSPRERESLFWCSQGKTNKEIAKVLDISDHIVNLYFNDIRTKLNATTNAHCVAIAIRKGII